MARVDLIRRAEIGRERRAKSRARILEAARLLFVSRPIASVTVEDVTRQARLSKGAFYSHFQSLDELRAVVAAELSAEFEDFLDSNVRSIADPVARIAIGCAGFIGEAQRDPGWAALIARGACAFPAIASAAGERLKASLRLAQTEGRLAPFSVEVGFDLVFGVVLQAMRSASEARLSPPDVSDVVRGILRALGVKAEEADRALLWIDEAATARRAGPAPKTNAI
ncbi:MAG TPA: helix-turn-helix domain-containing protein [Roseiarcus sp.]|nr:helix-turn-helix domain-containing protein [Roseiarcus sp.]